MESIDRKKIAKWFTPFPKWAVVFIVIGALLLFPEGAGIKSLGVLLAVIGALVIFMDKKARPTDQQMDAWWEEECKAFQAKAVAKCGQDVADCVAEEVVVWGPRLQNRGKAPLLVKAGKDKVIRYNPINLTVINFGPDQLLGYQCSYDRTTGNFLNESTDEYFYKDVVSVSTKTTSENVTFTIGKQNKTVAAKSQEMFELNTAGGTSIKVCVSESAILDQVPGGSLPTGQAEKAIQAVRRMLRDKKKA